MSIVMVHGGVDASTAPPYLEILWKAALSGHGMINTGPLDAAEEAVRIMEASPLFNAGYGSVLNRDGEVEMDASVMDGETGKFGAVAAIRSVSHPVSVARLVLEKTPHVLLVGQGATDFAHAMGFPPVDSRSPRMVEAWRRSMDLKDRGLPVEASPFTGLSDGQPIPCDTVGCVVSLNGRTAAASSTGGSFLKAPGRVGDTPIPGAGLFASARCAAACTGLGEAFIETLTAKYVDFLLESGVHPQAAAEKAIIRLAEKKAGATGGIILVDSRGRHGAAHNGRRFPVALLVNGSPAKDFSPQWVDTGYHKGRP